MSNMKQLKKSDFLAAVTAEPMTRGELVDALEQYDFIDTYLDYLRDHFVAQGKITLNEDGTFNTKGKKVSNGRDGFRVESVENEDGVIEYSIVTRPIKHFTDAVKAEGWALTQGAAIKNASRAVFADYKEQTANIKKLADIKPLAYEFVEEGIAE